MGTKWVFAVGSSCGSPKASRRFLIATENNAYIKLEPHEHGSEKAHIAHKVTITNVIFVVGCNWASQILKHVYGTEKRLV